MAEEVLQLLKELTVGFILLNAILFAIEVSVTWLQVGATGRDSYKDNDD